MDTLLHAHEWTIVSYTPIDAIALDTGPNAEIAIFVMDKPSERRGCMNCHTALSAATLGTLCEGSGDD